MRGAYIFLLFGFILLGAGIFWGGKLVTALPKKVTFSALSVEAIPEARVFLNDKELGKTPFEDEKLSPGEYTLRLLPETTASFSTWERKIKLNPGLLTYANYLFSPTESESAGEVLTLEKTGQGKGEIVVLSDPNEVNFSLDGKDQGAAPKALAGFETGEHEISFSFPGYHGRSLKIKTLTGYKILVSIKLAKITVAVPAVASPSGGFKVKILETPTGWLRVRAEPLVAATESAKVNPGEEYPLVEENKDWFKIQYDEGKEGWISSQYAKRLP